MPIIERIYNTLSDSGVEVEAKKEVIADLPDQTGQFDVDDGELVVTICPVRSKGHMVNVRKLILAGRIIGDQRRVMTLHPSPYRPTSCHLNPREYLMLRSQVNRKSKS